jgi:hypothetical protein
MAIQIEALRAYSIYRIAASSSFLMTISQRIFEFLQFITDIFRQIQYLVLLAIQPIHL